MIVACGPDLVQLFPNNRATPRRCFVKNLIGQSQGQPAGFTGAFCLLNMCRTYFFVAFDFISFFVNCNAHFTPFIFYSV
jgi:hypothetical protein